MFCVTVLRRVLSDAVLIIDRSAGNERVTQQFNFIYFALQFDTWGRHQVKDHCVNIKT